MSIENRVVQRRAVAGPRTSPVISNSSLVHGRPREDQKHRSCCRGIAIVFSVLSENKQSSQTPLPRRVNELREEVERQRRLKDVYKTRLDRMQEYLRYCLEVAKESGILDRITDQQPPPDFDSEKRTSPMFINTVLNNSHLAAVTQQAKSNGWFVEPHEVEIHEKIGEGTTAAIYRGTWRGLDVAIKWIHPHFFQSNESGQACFAQELDTLSRQRHPFVLRLLGACILPPENGWVVTELLSGKTLTEWLYGHRERRRERSKPLPSLKERLEKGLEIAQAMLYLHEQKPKIIHRDLKPSNILLDDYGHVRVADFGHARFLVEGEQALTGELVVIKLLEEIVTHTSWTYVYMAPEVIRSEPYSEKCDVYSFGIILNELITGQHPYIETSYCPGEIACEVGEGKLRPRLPEVGDRCKDLLELICSSWHKDASARPSFARVTLALKKIQQKFA